MRRRVIKISVIACLLGVGIVTSLAGDILKFNIIDNGTLIPLGRVVKIDSDTTIAICGSSDEPAGIIIGYEGSSLDPEYYLIANSSIASNVLCGEGITAGEKIVVHTSGSVAPLSAHTDRYVVGVALESGAFAENIKIMVNIVTGGGAGAGGGQDNDWAKIGGGSDPDTSDGIFHTGQVVIGQESSPTTDLFYLDDGSGRLTSMAYNTYSFASIFDNDSWAMPSIAGYFSNDHDAEVLDYKTGVWGQASGDGPIWGSNIGVYGKAYNAKDNYGVYGICDAGGTNNYAIYGLSSGGTNNYSGYFTGAVLKIPDFTGSTGLTTSEGSMFWDSDDDAIVVYDGSSWVEVGGGGGNLLDTYNMDGNTVQMTGTHGDVRFYNDTPDELLFLDESSGYIGVGTVTPSYKLHGIASIADPGAVGYFRNTVTTSDGRGVIGTCDNSDWYGIGVSGIGGYIGVAGSVTPSGSQDYYGVMGEASGGLGTNIGVFGRSVNSTNVNNGVYGYASGSGDYNYGVYGRTDDNVGSTGDYNFGVYGEALDAGGTVNYGIYGRATGGTDNYSGYFQGAVLRLPIFEELTGLSATDGSMFWDSDDDALMVHDGTDWVNVSAGGTGGLWTLSGDYIRYAQNSNARVYKSSSGEPYFYASSNDSDAAYFYCSRGSAPGIAAGVHGGAAVYEDNYGVYGTFTGGQWGYVGGKDYGVFGKFESTPRWSQGVLGAADTAVVGLTYSNVNEGYGGYFEVQVDIGSTENIYGVYSYANSNAPDTSFGIYAFAKASGSGGLAYGVYGKATTAGTQIGVYGESQVNYCYGEDYIAWYWIEDIHGTGVSHGGFVSASSGVTIDDNNKAAVYGKNTGNDYAAGVVGSATDGSSCSGVVGFGGQFGVFGISTGSGPDRAGGAFHCNNWSSKGSSTKTTGVGVFADGGTAGAVTLSPFLGIYSATTMDSEGGAAYFSGNSYISSGFSIALIDTAEIGSQALRVPAYDQVNISAKIQTEGVAHLEDGKCTVVLPQSFVSSIKDDERPVIILTPYSPLCNGLSVERFTDSGFVVSELNEGESEIEFSWLAIGTRKDFNVNDEVSENILGRNFDEEFSKELPFFSSDDVENRTYENRNEQ
ncbi:hypothetical protein KAH81_03605 [bacterium]|nr:hypothetical protein [bacterium]